jgi:type I restriction enzyme R subunit
MQHLNSWQRQQRAITNANNIGKTEAETRIIDEQLRDAGCRL